MQLQGILRLPVRHCCRRKACSLQGSGWGKRQTKRPISSLGGEEPSLLVYHWERSLWNGHLPGCLWHMDARALPTTRRYNRAADYTQGLGAPLCSQPTTPMVIQTTPLRNCMYVFKLINGIGTKLLILSHRSAPKCFLPSALSVNSPRLSRPSGDTATRK